MPWPEHIPSVQAFVEEAHARGWMLAEFDWSGWSTGNGARGLLGNPAAMAEATAADLFRLLPVIIRSERFRDGALLEALEDGMIDAITRRAAVLAAAGGPQLRA